MEPEVTVIDSHASFEGRLVGRDARILGRFRGEIELSGRLTTAEGSAVEATLHADSAEIAGAFSGQIAVRALLLAEKARVEATVEAEVLAVREGAVLQGSVQSGARVRPAEPRPAPPARGALGEAAAS